MALPQRDKLIDEIHRLEGLMAYAESHGEKAEEERIRAELVKMVEEL